MPAANSFPAYELDKPGLEQMDRASVLHPATSIADFASGKAPSTIVDTANGVRVRDTDGHELIDAFAGLYCVNIGYGRTEVADAIARQAHKLAYFHTYAGHSTEELIRLSDRLVKMAPASSGGGNFRRVFYGTSGSDANETQAKLVWYYHNLIGKPKKKRIIARERAYHGNTVMAGSMTGLSLYHDFMDLPVPAILRTAAPHHYWGAEPGESEEDFSARRAAELEALILREDPETIGGFIGEPVLGTGGLVPPPMGYWQAIQAVLRKYEILLIADEVITGFGRTGRMFGSQLYEIQPDLITIAKGLTSAYAPLSGVLVGERVFLAMEAGSAEAGIFPHGYTYTGHPIGVAAANANLDILERENLTANAVEVGAYMLERLHDAFDRLPITGEVRGVGLMLAVEFVADPATKKRLDPALKVAYRISTLAREKGLITRAMPQSDAIGFAPPLILTRGDADKIVEIAAASTRLVIDELTREGVFS
ncbi:aminotransferase [Acidicapsa acidisoli]|uniref:aminotransferase n=1 Tax=Acidicapsa acidisoli TaxID=1615681 RepID=UPI0021E027AE|nr:aminotransferase [Acidicapsa acidisoli]